MNPKARQEELLIHVLAEETVLFDSRRQKAQSPNPAAVLASRHCDGATSVPALASLLRQHDLPAGETVAWLALDRLGKAHLLEGPAALLPVRFNATVGWGARHWLS